MSPLPEILAAAKRAGCDMSGVARRIANGGRTPTDVADATHEVVIIGGGAAGIALASSFEARRADLDIAPCIWERVPPSRLAAQGASAAAYLLERVAVWEGMARQTRDGGLTM